jgi:diguanylate cyclase (GGDEF)-like protein/PAS domain S-box-containing protein
MTLDLDGRILEANATLEEVCDYPAGTLHGRPFRDYLDPSDHLSLARLAELSAGLIDRCRLEHRFRRNDSSMMWCRTVMALVRDGAGDPLHSTAMLEDISDRKQVEAELVHRTLHDALTGLPNRELFLERLRLARSRRLAGSGLAVLFMDVDRFKEVNDTLGHHAGDELLIAVARRLTGAVRPSDVVARFAGDEFLVLADEIGSSAGARKFALRLTESMRQPFTVAGETMAVTASLGVAYSAGLSESPEEILRRADAAMYLAKQHGRNRVEVFGEDGVPEDPA